MKTSQYLRSLRYDPKLGNSFFAKYTQNLRMGILILIGILVFGILSYLSLPRKLNPTINIPLVIVSTVLPGGTPGDMESLVTVHLEDAIRGIDNVKTISSSSRESVSIIQVEFESGVDAEKAKNDVESVVSGVDDLPEDALEPNIDKLDFENQPIWTFNLVAKNDDRASLIRFARNLKNDLEDLPSIDRVGITGIDEQEIQIILNPELINSYGLNPLQLTQSIKNGLNSFPAGNIRTNNSSFSLTIDKGIYTIQDIRDIKLNVGGQIASLGDIAEVKEISKPDQNQSYILHNQNINSSVSFSVFRVLTTNIEDAAHDAEILVEERLQNDGNNFQQFTILNTAELLSEEFGHLIRDVIITILLVFFVLLLFLGIRQAFISMLSVPLTFLITFIVMQITNMEFSFLATFSLLLSLGLLVDDTIVVISAMTSYYRTGKFTPIETALLVYRDFKIAIFTTTITTVWAFIPLILGSGIIGEFIKPIPIVVSSALLGSLFVALFITLPLMVFLLKPRIPLRVKILLVILLFTGIIYSLFVFVLPQSNIILIEILVTMLFLLLLLKIRGPLISALSKNITFSKKRKKQFRNTLDHGILSFTPIEVRYHRILEKILRSKSARRKTVIMVVFFMLFSFSLLPLGFVKNEFFPKTDEDNLYVSVELPTGTNLDVSRQEGIQILNQLKNVGDVDFISLETGQGFSSEMGQGSSSLNNLLFSFALNSQRDRSASDIAQEVRILLANYDKGKVSVNEVSGGPPAGADLQIKLFGPDLARLDKYANQFQKYLSEQEGVTNIDKTIKPGTSKYVFVPDQSKLAANNITLDQLGIWLRIFSSGFEAETIKLSDEEDLTQDITIRLDSASQYVENLSRVSIPTMTGPIPIVALGEFRLETNPTLITREDGNRTLSVTASVRSGFNVAQLNKELEKYADSLNLPPGYGWATGGVNEENQASVNSIFQAMIFSFILIIGTMVLQFTSFRRALIVMLVIPLSITGVFIIFAITQTPLSFPALIGVLALFGIVVKNSILVVDKILLNQKTGMNYIDSIIDASTSRLEPIALTSIATIVGLIPITLSDPLWRGLGGAIIAGLTFSGLIMLFFIPVVYYWWFEGEAKSSRSV